MKRFAAVILALVLAASMTACGGSSSSAGETEAVSAETQAGEETEQASAEETEAVPEEPETAEAETASSAADGEAPVLTSTDQVNIIWCHNSPESSAINQAALMFKERIEDLSEDRITVTVYSGGQMGSAAENIQGVRDGTIQMVTGTAGSIIDERLAYFDAPCLMTDIEQAYQLFGRGTELRQYTENIIEQKNDIKVLSFVPAGFRETFSTKKAAHYEALKDLQLKIRLTDNTLPAEYWKDWGCISTPTTYANISTALQEGTLDALDYPYESIVNTAFPEQLNYVIRTNHVLIWAGVYMNQDFYDSLPKDYQALIDWIWKTELDDYTYETCRLANEENAQAFADAGLEMIDFSDSDYAKMREDAKPVYDIIQKSAGSEVFDMLYKALDMK